MVTSSRSAHLAWVYGEIDLRVVGIEVTLKTVLFNDTFKRNRIDGEQLGTEDSALRDTKTRNPQPGSSAVDGDRLCPASKIALKPTERSSADTHVTGEALQQHLVVSGVERR